LPYVAAVAALHAVQLDPGQWLAQSRFVIEEIAIVLTAVTAAMAAFCSTVPGYDRRVLILPLPPLAMWLATLSEGCISEWLRAGPDGLALRPDWDCLPPAVMMSIVPAIAIFLMLRRGAPLSPMKTMAFAAMAVAALSNVALRIFHVGDASIMILAWHFATMVVVTLLAGWVGRRLLNWDDVQGAALR
jgi:hypothetical protein